MFIQRGRNGKSGGKDRIEKERREKEGREKRKNECIEGRERETEKAGNGEDGEIDDV